MTLLIVNLLSPYRTMRILDIRASKQEICEHEIPFPLLFKKGSQEVAFEKMFYVSTLPVSK